MTQQSWNCRKPRSFFIIQTVTDTLKKKKQKKNVKELIRGGLFEGNGGSSHPFSQTTTTRTNEQKSGDCSHYMVIEFYCLKWQRPDKNERGGSQVGEVTQLCGVARPSVHNIVQSNLFVFMIFWGGLSSLPDRVITLPAKVDLFHVKMSRMEYPA